MYLKTLMFMHVMLLLVWNLTVDKTSLRAFGNHRAFFRDGGVRPSGRQSPEPKTWRRKIRKAVKTRTHKPEMTRDIGYDLPATHNNILQRHPQGVGCARVLKAGRHHPWRRQVMAESSWRATNPVSATVKFYVNFVMFTNLYLTRHFYVVYTL